MHIVDHKSLKDDDMVARGCKIIKKFHWNDNNSTNAY